MTTKLLRRYTPRNARAKRIAETLCAVAIMAAVLVGLGVLAARCFDRDYGVDVMEVAR